MQHRLSIYRNYQLVYRGSHLLVVPLLRYPATSPALRAQDLVVVKQLATISVLQPQLRHMVLGKAAGTRHALAPNARNKVNARVRRVLKDFL